LSQRRRFTQRRICRKATDKTRQTTRHSLSSFYSLSRFGSDLCDLFICTFDAYFIKSFCILYIFKSTRQSHKSGRHRGSRQWKTENVRPLPGICIMGCLFTSLFSQVVCCVVCIWHKFQQIGHGASGGNVWRQQWSWWTVWTTSGLWTCTFNNSSFCLHSVTVRVKVLVVRTVRNFRNFDFYVYSADACIAECVHRGTGHWHHRRRDVWTVLRDSPCL